MTYAMLELDVIRWGEVKGIIGKKDQMAQALKTLEEVTELLVAIKNGRIEDQKDAYGDILVTLIMGCAVADFDLTTCLKDVYEIISKRKGQMVDGQFVKD